MGKFSSSMSFQASFFTILLGLGSLLVGASTHSLAPVRPLRIAIIDTGIESNHPFIKGHLWKNSGEIGVDAAGNDKSKNGIDDDGNGLVDDVHGWNFIQNNAHLGDNDGHGTHIAGVIKTAIHNTSPNTAFEFIVLKYYEKNASSKVRTTAFIDALEYAVSAGADIINISGGGPKFSERELRILEKASQAGIAIVAAAGNKLPDQEDKTFYPAAYDLPNIFSVVATDERGKILDTSNRTTARNVIYAVGKDVWSSLPNKKFGRKTGSSQAAAVFTGHIAPYIRSGHSLNLVELFNNSSQSAHFVSNTAN